MIQNPDTLQLCHIILRDTIIPTITFGRLGSFSNGSAFDLSVPICGHLWLKSLPPNFTHTPVEGYLAIGQAVTPRFMPDALQDQLAQFLQRGPLA